MSDQEEADLKMAMRMSMQNESLDVRGSRPRGDFPEDLRMIQRELMAAAAEKRMLEGKILSSWKVDDSCLGKTNSAEHFEKVEETIQATDLGRELCRQEAILLFSMIFGDGVSKEIIAQWCNQGIRFSSDPDTSMGLVQHEGGPCGVLAAIQAFVLKHLLFVPDASDFTQHFGLETSHRSRLLAANQFDSCAEEGKTRFLIRSMAEILFLCGNNKRAVVATLNGVGLETPNKTREGEVEVPSIKSALDLQKLVRVQTFTSPESVLRRLGVVIPIFQSRMGALLFLISALLSRDLDAVQTDRDDPSFPLVTAPFGHASQEIVNLLLCGQAVANVFDGRMDLGGGMSLKGVSTAVEVGFLTLLESLNFCKVGQNLKCPRWPIWVVGSESHYTVVFALDTSVQDESELEQRESRIRQAFESRDESGGGGFITAERFRDVLGEASISFPPETFDRLCGTSYIVWSEFWQAILELDEAMGGLKDTSGFMGNKVFDLYHFNGMAKSDINGGHHAPSPAPEAPPPQRPRLTKLRVSVPPRWSPSDFMADMFPSVGPTECSLSHQKDARAPDPDPVPVPAPELEPSRHAPLVDCIRTRWPRASCSWIGNPPSIV